MTLSLHDVRLAAERLRGNILLTPCTYSRTLSRITGAEVYLKFENLQFTAAFKERGALNKLLALTPKQRQRGVIAMSAAQAAQQLGAKYMVAFTQSGDTARRMSRLRAEIPLVVFTPEEKTAHWLTWCWGAQVFTTPSYPSNEDMVVAVNEIMQDLGLAKVGDPVVIVFGSPIGVIGKTNTLRVHRIKERD
ncbi:Pyruvate kinase [bioreactor metagenome]|uniref:Pyruvate kinase n=1 Tax=bioreactor metagenome TaxID=1076179 RepID=A0A645E3I2_9ZZZZ